MLRINLRCHLISRFISLQNDSLLLSSSPPSRLHQPLQRYPSVRRQQQQQQQHSPSPLMNISSEGSPSSFAHQLVRKDASDSGVDLTESGMNSSMQSLLAHVIVGRSHSANLTPPNGQENSSNHQFVAKTTSSPTPEQTRHHRSTFTPLSAVLSAPAPSMNSYYSDFRHQTATYQQQMNPTLTISDEDEQESQLHSPYTDNSANRGQTSLIDMNDIGTSKRLRQFYSLRNRNARTNDNDLMNQQQGVSQYLGVDGHPETVRNTFIQPNSGMRGTRAAHSSVLVLISVCFALRCAQMAEESSLAQVCLLLLANVLRADDGSNHGEIERRQNHRWCLHENSSEHQETQGATGTLAAMPSRHRQRSDGYQKGHSAPARADAHANTSQAECVIGRQRQRRGPPSIDHASARQR